MKTIRIIYAFLYKDLLLELRQKTKIFTPLFFGTIVVFLFSFAFAHEPELLKKLSPGLIWLTVVLSSLLHLEETFEKEMENGALDQWLLTNASPRSLFLGKCLMQWILIFVLQIFVTAQMFILFNLDLPKNWILLLNTSLLGSFGLAVVGSFYSALLSKLNGKQILFPLLFLPMILPLLLGCVFATQQAFSGNLFGEATLWLKLLVVFDTVFLAAGLLTIEPLLEVI